MSLPGLQRAPSQIQPEKKIIRIFYPRGTGKLFTNIVTAYYSVPNATHKFCLLWLARFFFLYRKKFLAKLIFLLAFITILLRDRFRFFHYYATRPKISNSIRTLYILCIISESKTNIN